MLLSKLAFNIRGACTSYHATSNPQPESAGSRTVATGRSANEEKRHTISYGVPDHLIITTGAIGVRRLFSYRFQSFTTYPTHQGLNDGVKWAGALYL